MGRWKERAQHTEERQRKETMNAGALHRPSQLDGKGNMGVP